MHLRNYVAQKAGEGTGKDGAPKKLCGSVRCDLGTGKMVCLRHCVAQLGGRGTGKIVRLRNLWISKILQAQERWCA